MNTSFRFPGHAAHRGSSSVMTLVRRWFACVSLGLAAAALFQTCVVDTNTKEEPIDPGRVYITSANIDEGITSLLWSTDNSKIYYTGPAGLNRVTLGSNTVSNVSAGSAMTSLSQSPDGSTLFYLTVPGSAGIAQLWSVPAAGGAAQVVADSISAYALSPDGQTIAACNQFSQGMFLIDRASGIRTPIGQGEPLLFSPDDQELMYLPAGSKVPLIQTLNGGAERPVLTATDSVNSLYAIRWGVAGIFAVMRDTLIWTGEGTYSRNLYLGVVNGMQTVFKTLYSEYTSNRDEHYYLSDTGQNIAYWDSDCLKAETIANGSCVTSQYSITLFGSDPGTKTSYVLHKTGYLTRGNGSISHDGTKFAYVAEGTLYLLVL